MMGNVVCYLLFVVGYWESKYSLQTTNNKYSLQTTNNQQQITKNADLGASHFCQFVV
jgi:hypothetical protein